MFKEISIELLNKATPTYGSVRTWVITYSLSPAYQVGGECSKKLWTPNLSRGVPVEALILTLPDKKAGVTTSEAIYYCSLQLLFY